MINRIILKKLTFYHHLLHLDDNSLAKQIFIIQEKLSYPGLVKECRELIQELRLSDARILSKKQWKSIVKRRIHQKNKDEILGSMASYKKIGKIKSATETFGVKPYLRENLLSDARLLFSSKCEMLKRVKMNQKNSNETQASHIFFLHFISYVSEL